MSDNDASWKVNIERALGFTCPQDWQKILTEIHTRCKIAAQASDLTKERDALMAELEVLRTLETTRCQNLREAEDRVASLRACVFTLENRLEAYERNEGPVDKQSVGKGVPESLLQATAKCVQFLMAHSSSHTLGLRGSSTRDDADTLAKALDEAMREEDQRECRKMFRGEV